MITQKMADRGRSDLCSFYHESLRTWIKTIANKLPISNHTALTSAVHALRRYLKLICEYELHSLPNKKVSGAKDHGKKYIKVRPPLVRHLLRNRLFTLVNTLEPCQIFTISWWSKCHMSIQLYYTFDYKLLPCFVRQGFKITGASKQ